MDSLDRLIEQLDRRDFFFLEQRGQLMNGAGDQNFSHRTLSRPLSRWRARSILSPERAAVVNKRQSFRRVQQLAGATGRSAPYRSPSTWTELLLRAVAPGLSAVGLEAGQQCPCHCAAPKSFELINGWERSLARKPPRFYPEPRIENAGP